MAEKNPQCDWVGKEWVPLFVGDDYAADIFDDEYFAAPPAEMNPIYIGADGQAVVYLGATIPAAKYFGASTLF